jgi:hypothetical protein
MADCFKYHRPCQPYNCSCSTARRVKDDRNIIRLNFHDFGGAVFLEISIIFLVILLLVFAVLNTVSSIYDQQPACNLKRSPIIDLTPAHQTDLLCTIPCTLQSRIRLSHTGVYDDRPERPSLRVYETECDAWKAKECDVKAGFSSSTSGHTASDPKVTSQMAPKVPESEVASGEQHSNWKGNRDLRREKKQARRVAWVRLLKNVLGWMWAVFMKVMKVLWNWPESIT